MTEQTQELQTEETPQLFELKDVEVSTVGLVTRGANREQFFLLKSANPQGDTLEEGTPQGQASDIKKVEDSLWKRIATFLRNTTRKEVAKALSELKPDAKESEEESTDDADKLNTENAEADGEKEESPEEESKEEPKVEAQKSVEATTQSYTITGSEYNSVGSSTSSVEVTPTGGSSTQGVIKMADIEKSAEVVALEKQVADMLTRVEKAERDAAIEKELRERAVYLEKADELDVLPIEKSELADHLFWLHKSDAKREEWLTGLLKATNNLIRDSALFKDMGTTGVRGSTESNDLLAKAEAMVTSGKAKDLKEALLNMDRRSVEVYVAKQQAATK